MRCCSPCHIALICINRYLFFYARHLHFRLSETGHPPQPRHTGQLRPARRGTLLDVAHDDRRVAGSARRFGPKRYTADFRGLLPERWSPPYEVTLDSGRTGRFGPEGHFPAGYRRITTPVRVSEWVRHAGLVARLAGLLHDLGKYSLKFQKKLRGKPNWPMPFGMNGFHSSYGRLCEVVWTGMQHGRTCIQNVSTCS